MDDVIIQLAENHEIQEAAQVLSFAMIDNPIHLAVYQGQGEKERVKTEQAFLDILNEIPAKIFLAKSGDKIIGLMRMRLCNAVKYQTIRKSLRVLISLRPGRRYG